MVISVDDEISECCSLLEICNCTFFLVGQVDWIDSWTIKYNKVNVTSEKDIH